MITGLLLDLGHSYLAYVLVNVMAFAFGEAWGGFMNKYFMALASAGLFLFDLSGAGFF